MRMAEEQLIEKVSEILNVPEVTVKHHYSYVEIIEKLVEKYDMINEANNDLIHQNLELTRKVGEKDGE